MKKAVAKGMQKGWFTRLLARESFSPFLFYDYYDEESCTYVTQDGQYGYAWEIRPVAFAGASTEKTIKGILQAAFPDGAVTQVMTFADPFITPIVERYGNKKRRIAPQDPSDTEGRAAAKIIDDNIRSFQNHILQNVDGMAQTSNVPIRNFRTLIFTKSPEPIHVDTRSSIEEGLSQFGCHHLVADGPQGLVAFQRRFFSMMKEEAPGHVDPTQPLRAQVIDAGYPISFNSDGDDKLVKVGAQFGRCLTPKTLPKEIDMLRMNRVLGGLHGVHDDPNQITSPFIWMVAFVHGDPKGEIGKKASIVTTQKGAGTFAARIKKHADEYLWAMDQLDEQPFLAVIPVLWIFGATEEKARDAAQRAKRLFDKEQFVMQEEGYLTQVLLPMVTPFGVNISGNNVALLDRHFYLPLDACVPLANVQGDFRGAGREVQMLLGRKGQLLGFDLFDPHLNNHNFVVAAESGAGKSFFLNAMLSNYYADGAKVRIIDIGYSYKKQCFMNGGCYIDLGDPDNVPVLNPFDTGNVGGADDLHLSMEVATTVLQLMATSATKSQLNDDQVGLLKAATSYVFASGRNLEGVDAVNDFLLRFEELARREDQQFAVYLKEVAIGLAWKLKSFASDGEYGKYFTGRSTLDISRDDWVVLELESLKDKKQLFPVVVMQVLNLVTQDLYLSNRQDQRFILFEEAASFLGNMGGDMTPLFAAVIEAGFRRARKYGGSMGVVLQSVNDIKGFKDVGDVIWENSATKFLLQGKSYRKAASDKLIPYEGLALELLDSVTNNKPKYSEIFIDSTLGMGVARLIVDPHSYWLYTSDAKEVARYNALINHGLSPADAIEILVNGEDQAVLNRIRSEAAQLAGQYHHAAE